VTGELIGTLGAIVSVVNGRRPPITSANCNGAASCGSASNSSSGVTKP